MGELDDTVELPPFKVTEVRRDGLEEGVRIVNREARTVAEVEVEEQEAGDPLEIEETTPLPAKREDDEDEPERVEDAVVRFVKGCGAEGLGPDGLAFSEFVRLPTSVLARRMVVPFECVTVNGEVVQGRAGDYVVVDAKGFPYPCDADVFHATHDPVEGWPLRPEARSVPAAG